VSELPPLPPFVLVTGNPGKRAEAERLLGGRVEVAELDLPEIQSLDLLEETGLELAALAGFPGPLVKWMLAAVGAEGIARVGLSLGDPAVVARCALLWRDGGVEVVAEGVTEGRLVLPARGGGGFGWDRVFEPAGERRTYAELPPAEKDRLGHRGRAWRALADRLAER
jgi:non-canonical purine NTP pyrophosphatase (RdgB/HAM1 family)